MRRSARCGRADFPGMASSSFAPTTQSPLTTQAFQEDILMPTFSHMQRTRGPGPMGSKPVCWLYSCGEDCPRAPHDVAVRRGQREELGIGQWPGRNSGGSGRKSVSPLDGRAVYCKL